MVNAKKIIKEGFPALTAIVIIEVVAGLVLGTRTDLWIATPAFLMLVPPLNDLGNDIGCILSSRFTTALHLGSMEPSLRRNGTLWENVLAAVVICIVSSLFIGVLVYLVAEITMIDKVFLGTIVFVGFVSGLMLTLLIVGVATLMAIFSWRRGLDPNNVTIPVVTAMADITGIFCLMLVLRLAGL
ncbi:MAG: magnesium transporter [Candidatus Bathyarchaeia archaeon]